MDGLLVGRFQPFHLGHLSAVDFALAKTDTLWLGIGSSNKTRERDNPFSADERQEMIAESLGSVRSPRVRVFPIPDVDDHQRWIKSIDDVVPRYGMVFTIDRLTAHLYSERGVRVVRVPLVNRDALSGTGIRTLIRDGGRWEHLVPDGTREVLLRLDAKERLASL